MFKFKSPKINNNLGSQQKRIPLDSVSKLTQQSKNILPKQKNFCNLHKSSSFFKNSNIVPKNSNNNNPFLNNNNNINNGTKKNGFQNSFQNSRKMSFKTFQKGQSAMLACHSNHKTSRSNQKGFYLWGILVGAVAYSIYRNVEKAKAKTKELQIQTEAPIYKIVMTGGPCGGKSTALSQISTHLEGLGFRVYTVPECATMLITGGVQARGLETSQIVQFQGNLIKAQIALEDTFMEIAKQTGQPSVIFCDRGAMDSQAYVQKDVWQLILDIFNYNTVQLRDERYDAIIHLVTAAIGAEKYYTTENNTARSETAQEARNLDFRLLNAWVGHRNLKVIDNSTDFGGKIQRVVSAVCETVGVPFPVENQRRLLISDFQIPNDIRFEEFEIEQTYLRASDENNPGNIRSETRIRRRGQGERQVYDFSTKKFTPDGNSTLNERLISGREYVSLLTQADPERAPVKKKVRCFSFNNQTFYLNKYKDNNLVILEVNSEDKHVHLPDWLKMKKDVTGDPEYSSYEIAKQKKKKFSSQA